MCEKVSWPLILKDTFVQVLCAVYGPHSVRWRSRVLNDRCVINCQYSMATFSTSDRRERPRGDRRSHEYARLIEKTFRAAILTELFPRAQVDIYCEVIEADGSCLAACINAATLALVDAGVPIRGLVAATTCACASNGTPCVDMNSREESSSVPRMTVATLSGTDELLLTELDNRLHVDYLPKVLDAIVEAAAKVHACLEKAVVDEMHSAQLVCN
ncbi:hypothetical protein AB6A40_002738 [Gnathostoma spinigerum]|uniref:Putative exosome complex component RRP41 n=1 Tax=Gnathostoma spinigerum TaxID=75299 RepID=A0ABD6ECZ9_9BILA